MEFYGKRKRLGQRAIDMGFALIRFEVPKGKKYSSLAP
jgi:hypothetical protein